MQISQAQHSDLSAIAAFINCCAKNKRHFTPISREQFAAILARDKRYGIKGLLVAKLQQQIVGVTHALRDAESMNGYIAFILAIDDSTFEHLLCAAEEYLKNTATIYIGSPDTPLYHTVEGRFQPLWGSTELMEIDAADVRMVSRLKHYGYTIKQTHVSLSLELDGFCYDFNPNLATELLSGEDCWYNAYNWYGRSSSQEFGQRNLKLKALILRKNETVMGHIAWYPMRDNTIAALCDFEIASPFRGKGLGKELLRQGLAVIKSNGYKSVELHTNPSESAAALHLYLSHGFIKTAIWYVCARHLRKINR